jgi:phage shock protein C
MNARWDSISERTGIYRNTQAGWIAGVCAGIADRLAIKPIWVRLVVGLACLIPHSFVCALIYGAAAFVLKPRAGLDATASSAGAQMAYRGLADTVAAPFGPAPGAQAAALKDRFGALDARLNRLEAAVLSDELTLRRKFRDIGAA